MNGFIQSLKKSLPCICLIGSAAVVLGIVLSDVVAGHFPEPGHQQMEQGAKLATQGRDNIPACASCHGPYGAGNPGSAIPRLAGINRQYLKKQLLDFARDPVKTRVAIEPIARDYNKTPRSYGDLTVFTPGTRRHDTMNRIARQLTVSEMENISAYYAALPFVADPLAFDFETLERGEDLAQRGKPEYGLPACDSCHGDKGIGHGADFPPLAGQPRQYIINQVNNWQNGLRDNDDMALMRHVANQLTDGDKQNVAAYYANQSYAINVE